MSHEKIRKEIIHWADHLSRKGFVPGKNGNISCQVEKDKLFITAHDAYLGHLEENEILLVDWEGEILEGELGLTSEKDLHLKVQRKFRDEKVVFHAHPAYTTAFYHYFDSLEIFSYEAKLYLGDIKAIPQETPAITDISPVLNALENNKIVVLENHGVVSMGANFKEAFSYIESLEEQAKVNLLIQGIRNPGLRVKEDLVQLSADVPGRSSTYTLLSKEHISRLVELVNHDEKTERLGLKYGSPFSLALKNKDTGECVCFYYDKGKIIKTDKSQDADFLFVDREVILKKVFNSEIDPLVASLQRKISTEGDVGQMIQWYPLLVRQFKLWTEAPVE